MSITEQANADGYDAGKAAGSWVIDGNTTTETADHILRGYDDGDPAIMDMQPAPLSGEWADGPTPDSIARSYEQTDPDVIDELCDAYEDGFASGYWDEVVRSARAAASEYYFASIGDTLTLARFAADGNDRAAEILYDDFGLNAKDAAELLAHEARRV